MSAIQSSPSPRRPLALSDLAALRAVSDPQMSPDGTQIAFVVETIDPESNEARSRIWLVEARNGAQPRPLTSGEKRDSQPRFSPDGRRLAFISDRTGRSQLWVLPLDGGEALPLTDHQADVSAPAWSPDGAWLAFVAEGSERRDEPFTPTEEDPRRRLIWVREHYHKYDGVGFFGPHRPHLWLVPAAGGRSQQLTDGPYEDSTPTWSPGGGEIAFISDRSAERDRHFKSGQLHVVEVASGTVRCLTDGQSLATLPSWSPDGRQIAYLGIALPQIAAGVHLRLWTVPAAGGPPRCWTTDLDRSVGQAPTGTTASTPAWAADGLSILFLVSDGPATHLARLTTQQMDWLTTGRWVVSSVSIDRAGETAALLVTGPTAPPEVWLWDAAGGARPLTEMNANLLAEVALAAPEDLSLSRPDGTVVEGWLLRPPAPATGLTPLVLRIHGGPHSYFGFGFDFDHQLFAAQGWAVLYPNPRGSGGYSESFAQAVWQDWGGADYQDLMAMVDHVLARPELGLDPDRLAVNGYSYGGFMTCWAVTQTSRFRVAASGGCLSNLVSFFGTSDIGPTWGEREFGGLPYERFAWYWQRSPLAHAPQVQTPLFLYHGEADLRCPVEQSEQMFTALKRLGKTVELLRAPGESHGFLTIGSPAHRFSVRQAILDWFHRYL